MAGQLPDGSEALALQTTETVYEPQQVQKEVCDYEYDPYTGEDEYKCGYEYVYEDVPVERTIYKVSNGVVPRTFSNPEGAISYIGSHGVQYWRRAS